MNESLISLFEKQVKLNPDAIAIICEEQSLTYDELNDQVNIVAYYLRQQGVQSESLVAVHLPRSIELIIAILAVIKADGAYVPIDIQQPEKRVEWILDDLKTSFIISNTVSNNKYELINIESLIKSEEYKNKSVENIDCIIKPSDLAYIIYTSGSTGTPKGVMIEHRNLMHYLTWCITKYVSTTEEIIPFYSSCAFDMSITSIFVALLTGNTLMLLHEDLGQVALMNAIKSNNNFAFIKLTPTHLNVFKQQLQLDDIKGTTKQLIIGGERLMGDDIKYWQDYDKDTIFINEYGPTEATVGCCTFELKQDDFSGKPVPIGKAIPGSNIYILDKYLKPVPPGVIGEIYIGGAGVARGYWNNPKLTEKSFIDNPFVKSSASKMYKTGDRARYNKTGEIEYIGREDNQIKLHGYRIELAEIDAAIKNIENVSGAVTVLRDDIANEPKLIAYIICDENKTVDNIALKDELALSLPNHMLPHHIVTLTTLPMTANGKIDIDALPKPEKQTNVAEQSKVTCSPIVKLLIELWEEVLGVENIREDDDFFQLGGDSILCIQMISKATQHGIQFDIGDVFEYPTIAALSSLVPNENIKQINTSAEQGEQESNVQPSAMIKQLMAIWVEILQVNNIAMDDDFFQLGGDSILCIQMIYMANQAGIDITIDDVFEQPTISALCQVAQWQEQAAPAKVIQSNAEQIKSSVDSAIINLMLDDPNNVEDYYPLTPLQKGILFGSLYSNKQDIYTIHNLFEINGVINQQHFMQAWQMALQHYSILRTKFLWEKLEEPMQVVMRSVDIKWLQHDLSHIPQAELKAELDNIIDKDRLLGFHLDDAPLMRLHFIKVSATQNHFLWAFHHLLLDGWSGQIILDQCLTVYRQLNSGKDTVDIVLTASAPFRNYVDYLSQYDLSSAKDYWQSLLAPIKKKTVVSRKHLINCNVSSEYHVHELALSDEISSAAIMLAKQAAVTLNVIMQAAWATLLAYYNSNSYVNYGVTVSGRTLPIADIETIVGMLINTLPLVIDVNQDYSLETFFKHIHKQISALHKHSGVPLSQIQRWWNTEEQDNNLFDSLFIFENFPYDEASAGDIDGFTIQSIKAIENTEYPLCLVVIPEKTIIMRFIFDNRHFDIENINDIFQKLQFILGKFKDLDNTTQLKKIHEALQQEQMQKINHWNSTNVNFQNKTVVQLFEEQVSRTPDNIALQLEHNTICYAELDKHANQCANYLALVGVRKNNIVALCLPRSVDLITLIFAVLKLGAAYLPLDTSQPQQRQNLILEEVQPELLIIDKDMDVEVYRDNINIINIDTLFDSIMNLSSQKPSTTASMSSLAYIIYTSGTTGRPKGVTINHNSFSNYIQWCHQEYPVNNQNGMLLHTSIAFDMAITTIFTPLIAGNKVCIVNEAVEEHSNNLGDYLQQSDSKLDVLKLTPSHLRMLATQLSSAELQDKVNAVVIGGEALSFADIEFWLTADSKTLFYNEYGPTEATVACSYHLINRTMIQDNENAAPIGKPIANTQLYILDEQHQVAAIGAIGELYVAGAGLAQGYIKQQELTEQQFVTIRIGQQQLRLYKTGDLACYLANGDIKYLGRSDRQIKIRGYRIELAEIEQILSRHPQVNTSYVNVVVKDNTLKRICAYLIIKDELVNNDKECLIADIKEYCNLQMPDYMHPNLFFILDQLPLNKNGKVDEKALPIEVVESQLAYNIFEIAKTDKEVLLADAWCELLSLEQLSIHDNFFSLGGDSILSLQLVSRIRSKGLILSIKDVFQAPTVAEQAALAEYESIQVAATPIVTSMQGDIPLTPIQEWFFATQHSKPEHFNQVAFLNVHKRLDLTILCNMMRQLICHHDILRTRFLNQNEGWMQHCYAFEEYQNCIDKFVSVVNLSQFSSEEIDNRINLSINAIQASLNLKSGPLFRVILYDCGLSRSQQLFFVVHHLLVDGVSWRIILEDMEQLCQQLVANKELSLPAKTASYQQWANTLLDYVNSDVLKTQLQDWKNLVDISTHQLTTDTSSTELTIEQSDDVVIKLDKELTTKLLRDVPKAFNTQINDILLSALTLCLHQWQGSNSFAILLEGHGRENIAANLDISRTVGWFTSMFPVILTADLKHTHTDTIKSIKETLRAIPMKGVGFAIMKHLSSDAETRNIINAISKPEICFNYLGQWHDNDNAVNDKIFTSKDFITPNCIAKENKRTTLIDFVSEIANSQLTLICSYSSNHFQKTTIENVANLYIQCLTELINYCTKAENFGYTPSDFPLADISQQQLDILTNGDTTIQNIYPLSPMQQGLLFYEQMYVERQTYFMQSIFVLNSENLNVNLLHTAWHAVCEKHDIMRTRFVTENLDLPLQIVNRDVNLAWHEVDWSKQQYANLDVALDEYLLLDRQDKFDLYANSAFRVIIIKYNTNQAFCIVSHHHILFDGWCWPLIWSDIQKAYDQLLKEKLIKLDYARPYSAYIAWQENCDINAATTFWKQHLAAFNSPTRFDYIRNTEVAINGLSFFENDLVIASDVSNQLRQLAKVNGVTLNTVMQLAWAILLSRYTRNIDIAFGVAVSGRSIPVPGVENIVGLFINTLPMRIKLADGSSIKEQLCDLQQKMSEMQTYGYLSLATIQTLLTENHHENIFDSILVYENIPENTDDMDAPLLVEGVKGIGRNEYPLTVLVLPDNELTLKFKADKQHFCKEQVAQISRHLNVILLDLISGTNESASNVIMLAESEKQEIIYQYNNTNTTYPSISCVQERFIEQVDKQPTAIAIIYKDEQLSFSDLDMRANQLANHMIDQYDIKHGDFVYVCLERSNDAVIALLAILKIGAVYVPVEANYPMVRITKLFSELENKLLVTKSYLLGKLSAFMGDIIRLDVDKKLINCSQKRPDISIQPADNAFVLFTSGSTGEPKAVLGTHANMLQRFQWMWHRYSLKATDRQCMLAPINTIDTFWEMLGAVSQGITTVITSQEDLVDSEHLIAKLKQWQVTRIDLVPSLLRIIMEHHANIRELLPQLKFWGVNGEYLDPQLTLDFCRAYPEAMLLNRFGSTEATSIYCEEIQYDIAAKKINKSSFVTDNSKVYILNKALQVVPTGVIGALYVTSNTMTKGYINNEVLTSQHFINNPFEESRVMYKTGDMARFLFDGSLELFGREDDMVKIRGNQVSLKEVENILKSHELISNAVLVTKQNSNSEMVLYAFLKMENEDESVDAVIRQWLQDKLPSYMTPEHIHNIASFPITANGKIDRIKLITEYTNVNMETVSKTNQLTALEQDLLTIWQELLTKDSFGIDDSFFLIGGHSLIATRLMARVKRKYKVNIPLRLIFEAPTIREMASKLNDICDDIDTKIDDISVNNRSEIASKHSFYPLSFIQRQMWVLDKVIQTPGVYNLFNAFELHGKLNISALEKAFNELCKRHSALRTSFIENDDGSVTQEIKKYTAFLLSTLDAREFASEQQEIIINKEMHAMSNKKLKLDNDQLMQTVLIQCHDNKNVLLILLHHIITDRWSNGIIFKELNILYTSFSNNYDITLPDVAQYYQYAENQQSFIQTDVYKKQLAYWQNKLEGISGILQFPADVSPELARTHEGAIYQFQVSEDKAKKVKQYADANNATLFMTLLSCYYIFLYLYTGEDDILVGSPVAHRQNADYENTIGCFINTLVFRCLLNPDWNFKQLLAHVKEIALQAYDNQDVPFDALVETIDFERDLDVNPIYQVAFVLQNVGTSSISLGDLKLKELENTKGTAKFDFSLIAVEDNNSIAFAIEYAKDVFSLTTIQHMAIYFENIIDHVLARDAIGIASMELLNTEDKKSVIQASRGQSIDYFTNNTSILQIIFDNIHHNSEAVAVITPEQTINYAALLEMSDLIATLLYNDFNITVGDKIAVCCDASIELVAYILAIFKLGAVYVPIDPLQPEARITYVINKAKVKCILTKESLRASLEGQLPPLFVFNNEHKLDKKLQAKTLLKVKLNLESLAYIIFTSGSTGKPKGVAVNHRNLINSTMARNDFYQGGCERFLLLSSIGFDSSIAGIFWCLVNAKTLVLPEKADITPGSVAGMIQQYNVDTTLCIPSFYQMLINEELATNFSSLKHIILAGENVNPNIITRHDKVNPHANLYNEYGPSEATVWSSAAVLYQSDTSRLMPITIGKPINNTAIYILNPHQKLQPTGVIGEIYIAGENVTQGYYDDPQLTTENFISLELDGKQPIYKSGDLGRYLDSGDIEILGRRDQQIKINGCRVELAEVEKNILMLDFVSSVAVIASKQNKEITQLVAYVVLERNAKTDDLNIELIKQLPNYMLPNRYVYLDSLPLLENGKVSYKALSVLVTSNEKFSEDCQPRTIVEERLLEEFKDILQRDSISIFSDFFDSGGNSLLAIMLVNRIQKHMHCNISIVDIFSYRTVVAIAKLFSQRRGGGSDVTDFKRYVLPIKKSNTTNKLILFHQASGLASPYSLLADMPTDYSIYAISNPRYGDHENAFTSIEKVARYYIQIVKSIQADGPYVLAGWSYGGVLAFEIARQLQLQGDVVENVILIDSFNFAVRDKVDTNKSEREEYMQLYLSEKGISPDSHDGKAILFEFEHSYQLARNYLPQVYNGKVSLIKSSVPRRANKQYWKDPFNGWYNVVTNNINILSIAAEHNHLFDHEHVGLATEIIKDILENRNNSQKSDSKLINNLMFAVNNNDSFLCKQLLHFYKHEFLVPGVYEHLEKLLIQIGDSEIADVLAGFLNNYNVESIE